MDWDQPLLQKEAEEWRQFSVALRPVERVTVRRIVCCKTSSQTNKNSDKLIENGPFRSSPMERCNHCAWMDKKKSTSFENLRCQCNEQDTRDNE
ncbi:hypothetical protein AVEN_2570-1 [Araneus ventricosus]|uniref:Uncharacterized protein n=1 Tax=Araneus ventricosus TaxID=182803 RepID=A0A4Y2GPK3_ARAVE|nr:hypothetical protein AVEN_2570-1 [Araneus ventricosus]